MLLERFVHFFGLASNLVQIALHFLAELMVRFFAFGCLLLVHALGNFVREFLVAVLSQLFQTCLSLLFGLIVVRHGVIHVPHVLLQGSHASQRSKVLATLGELLKLVQGGEGFELLLEGEQFVGLGEAIAYGFLFLRVSCQLAHCVQTFRNFQGQGLGKLLLKVLQRLLSLLVGIYQIEDLFFDFVHIAEGLIYVALHLFHLNFHLSVARNQVIDVLSQHFADLVKDL